MLKLRMSDREVKIGGSKVKGRIRWRAALLAFSLAFVLLPAGLRATMSCWEVQSWTPIAGPGEPSNFLEANKRSVPCWTLPDGWGWTYISVVSPYNGIAYQVRISLTDSFVANWKFSGDLSVEPNEPGQFGAPLIKMKKNGTGVWLKPYPPQQGPVRAGSIVRLRHSYSDQCVYTNGGNGSQVKNWACWNDPAMAFRLEDGGGGTFRLRNQANGQCPYAQTLVGAPALTWQCWSDPNLRFAIEPHKAALRLRHVNTGQCLYGSSWNGGFVSATTCGSSANFRYWLDVIQY
jgi:hypothetical protein